MNKIKLLWTDLGHFRGQNGGQKGQNVPFSRKSEYFDLKLANYTLNHIEQPTAIQMEHEDLL